MLCTIRNVRPLLWLPLLFAALSVASPLCGQNSVAFKAQDPGKGFVEIGGTWHFHTGDDPAWAQPAYDDSSWEQLRGDTTWGSQTHPAYAGFAWYRKPIEVTAAGQPPAILVPPVDDAYELYWNGKKVGGSGKLPPHAYWDAFPHARTFALPSASGLLALRVWQPALASTDPITVGGLETAPRIGDLAYLTLQNKATRLRLERGALPSLVSSALMIVAGLIALLLFLRERTRWLYLWLAIYLNAIGISGLRNIVQTGDISFFNNQLYLQFFSCAADVSLWAVLLALFGLDREKKWRQWTLGLALLYASAQVVDLVSLAFWEQGGSLLVWTDAITTAIYSIAPLFIVAILIGGLRRRRQMDLWPLAFIIAFAGLWVFMISILGQGLQITHWDNIYAAILRLGFTIDGYRFGMRPILETLVFIALVFTVAREQYIERRRQTRMEMEVKSAREVQQVLVPETVPTVPGFAIDSVYKPAAELGGDFFQVIALPDGSTLIVIGDVSGKGLKAAMTVSLIVGTLRTLTDYTQEPAEILQGMNRRLCGRVQDGFATCEVLRVKANGDATIANAGHLAPFRDGQELPLHGSLPLGLADDAIYEELAFRLHEGETLTLFSDGIVEARNVAGELYGFERLQTLAQAKKSAEQIVEAACVFGQEDDITVLSIRRLAAAEEPAEARMNLTAQIATV
ncbi:MAG: SpoIIE family protein phosphatase [Acidobacteriaceae bacterium]